MMNLVELLKLVIPPQHGRFLRTQPAHRGRGIKTPLRTLDQEWINPWWNSLEPINYTYRKSGNWLGQGWKVISNSQRR